MTYPFMEREPVVDVLHGRRVEDPYRRLEDPGDPHTLGWLACQEELWRRHAARLPLREHFLRRLADLARVGMTTPPIWRGGHRFHLSRSPGQEHPVLHRDGRPVLDPMELDHSGLTTLDEWQPSPDGRLLAYQISRRGTEQGELYVLDLETGAVIDGPIGGCRYSPVAWLPGAFHYVRFHDGVYLHRLGTPRHADTPILTRGALSYGLEADAAGRSLVISAGTRTGNALWLADLSADPVLRPIQAEASARSAAAVGPDGRLYILTDRDAPRHRICVADPAEPQRWTELVPEDPEATLGSFTLVEGPRLLVSAVRHAVGEIGIHDPRSGKRLGTVPLPGSGTVGSLTSRPGGAEAWFTYTDAVTPPVVWRYDARTETATPWATPPGLRPPPEAVSRRLTYRSADGTTVRMVVVAPPGDGPRPAILTGYGGFGVPLTPVYAADSLAWVEAGGLLAVANLRGGGEEGEQWHRDGMLERKQNVFDDYIAAAEHLVATGLTTPDRLAAWGESNGGLLVGAALTQRPDLFAAAVCAAPLLDMARYERTGLGSSWTAEYGTAADPGQLDRLLAYSPYHAVRQGVRYPATLFAVSAADTRVDPMHARKMCAALQWATAGTRPILLRHEPDVGHGARAVSRSITLAADALAFLVEQTGLRL